MDIFVVAACIGGGSSVLQLVACHRHDCLLSDSLLGNLLGCVVVCSECDWLLCPEGSLSHLAAVMYSLIFFHHYRMLE